MGGAPLLSATWFPAEQRTTATAIAAVMNGVGVSISFIIGENAVAYLHYPTPIPIPRHREWDLMIVFGSVSTEPRPRLGLRQIGSVPI